jgi:hypothetical protein
MPSKCQNCRTNDTVWAWQPFGPDETIYCFTTLGSHYRGFPAIGICDDCRNDVLNGMPGVLFTYKKVGYCALDGKITESPF